MALWWGFIFSFHKHICNSKSLGERGAISGLIICMKNCICIKYEVIWISISNYLFNSFITGALPVGITRRGVGSHLSRYSLYLIFKIIYTIWLVKFLKTSFLFRFEHNYYTPVLLCPMGISINHSLFLVYIRNFCA